jgi:hypothetical protein
LTAADGFTMMRVLDRTSRFRQRGNVMWDLDFSFADDRPADDEIFGEPDVLRDDAIGEARHAAMECFRAGDIDGFRRMARIADAI